MAITREQKETQVAQLVKDIGKSRLIVVTNYKGLAVEQMQQLRRELKAADCQIRVIKNSLIKRALEQNAVLKNLDQSVFEGPVALVFGYEDEAAPAQIVAKFAKINQYPEIIGAFDASGDMLSAEQANKLANLLSKEQLFGQLVGTVVAPLIGFMAVLNGNIRGLVQVLNSYKESQVKSN